VSAVLDRPIWQALTTRHAEFADMIGGARCFAADIGPLAATRDDSAESLAALGELLARHGSLVLFAQPGNALPPGAVVEKAAEGVQMVARRAFGPQPADGLVALGDADAAEMVALAELTQPGPFRIGTHRLGQFWGVRHEGRLVAMAGERLQVEGFAEVSGVCTHPDHRGRGHAVRLMRYVGAQIEARGETPILHSYAANTGALRIYESLGFETRSTLVFTFLRAAD
jgi:predicted GNAT family acetyltransferase